MPTTIVCWLSRPSASFGVESRSNGWLGWSRNTIIFGLLWPGMQPGTKAQSPGSEWPVVCGASGRCMATGPRANSGWSKRYPAALKSPRQVRWIALHGSGNLALAKGEYARAQAYYEESLVVTRQLEAQHGIANSLLNLSMVVFYQGDYRRAIALQEEALAIHRELGNNVGIALALNNLAKMLEHQGDYDRSAAFAQESLTRYRDLRDSRGVAWALHDLAIVAHRRG